MPRIRHVLCSLILLAACSGKETVPAEVLAARTAEEAGKPEEARKLLEQAEAARLGDAVYSFELAMLSLRHFDDFHRGEIRTITVTNPGFKPFGRAVRMNDVEGRELGYLLRDLSPVIAILDRAIGRDRTHVRAWLEKANLYAEMNRQAEALATLSNARAVNPDDARLPYLTGTILLHNGRTTEAERAFALADRLDGAFAAASLWQGTCLLTLEQPDAAEKAFNRTIRADDGGSDAQKALQKMFSWYYERKLYDKAYAWGERHLDLARRSGKLYRYLGIAAFMSGHYDQAREWLPEAIQRGGEDALALALLGQIHTSDGKYAEAEILFRRSLKLRETVQVLSQLGSLYLEKLKQPEQAISLLERTISLQPDHYLARFQLAMAYRSAGRDKATELAAWQAYLATAGRITHQELGEHEKEFMNRARARIRELQD